MTAMNKVILIGYLGHDPALRETCHQQLMATLRVVVKDTWQDKNGETQEKAHWYRILFFSHFAEAIAHSMKKGHHLYIEGRLQNRSWQDHSGQRHTATEIIGQKIRFLGLEQPITTDLSFLNQQKVSTLNPLTL